MTEANAGNGGDFLRLIRVAYPFAPVAARKPGSRGSPKPKSPNDVTGGGGSGTCLAIFRHGHCNAAAFGHGHFDLLAVLSAPSALRAPGPVRRIAGARPRLVVLPRALNLVLEGTPVGGPVVVVHILLAARGAVPGPLGTLVPALCLQAFDWAAANPNARPPHDSAIPAHPDFAVFLGGRHWSGMDTGWQSL